MHKEEKKKSWKEVQRERQLKKQQIDEEYQKEKETKAKTKPRKLPKGKIIFAIFLVTIIIASFGTWQYCEGQKPPTIGGGTSTSPVASPSSAGSAPDFSLKDINGSQVSLSQFKGEVIGIHFMAVGCGGQIDAINEYELNQVKGTCNNLCGAEQVTFLTVAVATCEDSKLDVLRKDYGVSWILGNDYADQALEIVNAYVPYEIGDGTVVLIDKTFNIAQVYSGGVPAETLISKISQLLEA